MLFTPRSEAYSIPAWVSSRTYFGKSAVRSVVINEQTSDFYTLDDASARLWAAIEEGCSPQFLTQRTIEYGVADDIEGFVLSLVERGLVAPMTGRRSPPPPLSFN